MSPVKRAIVSAFVVYFVIAASPCFGWGKDGHQITGTIATHYLTPEAKAAIQALLGDQSLADVSTWADEIRSDRAYRWANPLHYSNVKPGEAEFDLSRDCPERGCVVSAINKYTGILSDKDASHAEKTEALKFLIHFVGDIHQPLHVSHAKDKGGNDIKVELFHNLTNLHRLWDSGLIHWTKKQWTDYATELRQGITPEQLAEWSKVTDSSDWATESYKLALSHAYEVPKDGQLSEAYFDRSIPVVDNRLAVAGVRMATMLNAIFADGGSVDPNDR